MTIQNSFTSIQFGICYLENNEEKNFLIPVDNSIQSVLKEMLSSFNEIYYEDNIDNKKMYEPSEKYSATEKLYFPIDNENITKLKDLFEKNNIPTNNLDLSNILSEISYYYGIFNNDGEKIIGVKRPSQFKGLIKNKNKLIKIIDDSLMAVNDDIFKLDNDFDFVISKDEIRILHPTGFVFISDVDKYVLEKSGEAAIELGTQIKFINFKSLHNL